MSSSDKRLQRKRIAAVSGKELVSSMKLIALGGMGVVAILFSFASILESAGFDPWACARPERKFRVKVT